MTGVTTTLHPVSDRLDERDAPDPADRTVATATSPPGQLVAESDGGAAMVAIAEHAAGEFAAGAMANDRAGTFAEAHLQRLRRTGFLAAPIPVALGGGGVAGTRDVLVAASRLARADAATAIGVNMHLAVVGNLVRAWSVATTRGDERVADRLGRLLHAVATSGTTFASPVSEPGVQDLSRPATTATRTADGWRVSGRKAFATMAAHATILSVGVTYIDDRGDERYGFAFVPVGVPGLVFHDDWDALGMRASASGSVSFHDVHVDASMLSDCAPAGRWTAELMDRYLGSGALHAAASLGIAEAAHAHAVGRLRTRAEQAASDPHVIAELAANATDLAAMRASLDRAGRVIDAYHATHPTGGASLAEVHGVTAEVQAGKAMLNQAAVRVVDRALAVTGGAGYRAADPLAKAWRDVRAGPFMHPIGANRVGTFLARHELGLERD
jgi:alkylation response protein AidB-like acyl-CoA dehydrogenase